MSMVLQRRSMMTVNALALALACLLWPPLVSAQFDAATVLGRSSMRPAPACRAPP